MKRRSFFCRLTASGLMCSYIDIARAPIVLTVIEANFCPEGVEIIVQSVVLLGKFYSQSEITLKSISLTCSRLVAAHNFSIVLAPSIFGHLWDTGITVSIFQAFYTAPVFC